MKIRHNKSDKTRFYKLTTQKGIYCLLLAFCSLLQSCNWFFHNEEIEISELKTYAEYENATNGVYALLEKYMSSKYFFYPSVKGDDIFEGQSDYSLIYGNCNEDEYSYADLSWENLYKTIASSNNVIVQYNNNGSELISQLAGEAYFIRAYCYFRLAKIYGRIPLVDDIDVDYTLPLPSFQEVYEFIESDLFLACSLLPDNRENARIHGVTIHRGTAKAILAELYLYWGGYPVMDGTKYKLAAAMAAEVIDSAAYFGFVLEGDFANLWKQSSLYSYESVFSIYITNNLYYTSSSESWYNFNNDKWRYSPSFYYFDQVSYWSSETDFYNTFPKSYRRDITFINSIDYYLQDTSYNWVENHTYIDSIEVNTSCLKLAFRKFFYDMTEEVDIDSTETKIRIKTKYTGIPRVYLYRYAHTLLTYAEAAARSGNLNEKANDCLNMIRRRANNVDLYSTSKYDIQPGLSAEQFADLVVQERAWELAAEPEGRWFDQIRTGQAGEDCFFDIPHDDIYLNPILEEE